MIVLDDVSVTYPGNVQALKPTSIHFAAGEFTVLLGPSGAGKSTLLRSLNGLVGPTGGRIVSDSGNISDRKILRQHRRKTAMVFQQHQLIGRLSALRNVAVGRLAYYSSFRTLLPLPKADKHLALTCLKRVGLLDEALRRADQLSGGQQQRVGIARAIAQQPSLILADEPVASLDPATAMSVLTMLHDICRSDNISAIVSLHQVELARHFADRVVGISAGEVVFDGAQEHLTDYRLEQIYGQPAGAAEPSDTFTTPATSGALALAME